MAKVTMSQLLEMVEELRAEIESLKEQISPYSQVQLVAEVKPPKPLSKPIDWLELWTGSVSSYQAYTEEEWGYGTYI
jgi:hypothetical protein